MLQQDVDAANGLERISYLLVRFRLLEEEFLTPESQSPEQVIPVVSFKAPYLYI